MLNRVFESQENKTFLQTADTSYNYQWLQQKIKKTIGLFNSFGLKQDDRVLLAVSDDVEMSALFLSALAAGIVVVIADPEMKSPRAKAIIQRSEPHLIIADKESIHRWELNEAKEGSILPFEREAPKKGLLSKFLKTNKPSSDEVSFQSRLDKVEPAVSLPAPPPDNSLAYIIFTSGTTADSKGVAITRGNLSAHLATLRKVYGLDQSSKIFNQLLLCHADGCIQGPLLAAYAGCAWHRPHRFSIEKVTAVLDYCYANNISHIIAVPAMLNMMVQFGEGFEDSFGYPQFKAMISVSAHLEAPVWDRFESIFKIQINNVYGLTETVAGSLFCGPLPGTYQKYSVGKPVDCEVKIVDDNEVELPTGQQGELWLKGSHIMKGYWRDEKTTAESFINGWFRTGDLAIQDESGYVTIKGRKKNLIISGGINIQPEEVTECLMHHPAIQEACALGVADDVFGEKLIAAVVVKPEAPISATELTEHCRKWLDDKKVPHKIHQVASLPKGVSGKIQLNALREQLQNINEPINQTSGDILPDVIALAAEVFQVQQSSLSIRDTSYTVAGWDSLAHLIFITSLEEKFGIRFSTAEVMTMNSINKAVDLVTKKTCIASPAL